MGTHSLCWFCHVAAHFTLNNKCQLHLTMFSPVGMQAKQMYLAVTPFFLDAGKNIEQIECNVSIQRCGDRVLDIICTRREIKVP